jgi:hypothetical protein
VRVVFPRIARIARISANVRVKEIVSPAATHFNLSRLLIRGHSRYSRAEKEGGRGQTLLANASGYY